MASLPNLSIYTPTEIQELLAAVKAERLRRLTGGTVTSGSKNGKSYSVQVMSDTELNNLEDALAKRLGKSAPQMRRVSFSHTPHF